MSTNTVASDENLYYGTGAWRLWEETAPPSLRSQKLPPAELIPIETHEVTAFRELARIVAFLNVMNKKHHLLFRGQTEDFPLRPTLLRDTWNVPKHKGEKVDLRDDRQYYWDALDVMSSRIGAVLRDKLPRHRPFDDFRYRDAYRLAPWAVIQHYELWPTPVLDFTGSLRVAASFAFGTEEAKPQGYLYVTAMPPFISDLDDVTEDASVGPVAVRLSAVCPPSASRPHLQDGFLVGEPHFNDQALHAESSPGVLVAKFLLLNDSATADGQRFWDNDFPPHTQESLLPSLGDVVLAAFHEAFEYRLEAGRVVLVER
jgi:hypothetical protein